MMSPIDSEYADPSENELMFTFNNAKAERPALEEDDERDEEMKSLQAPLNGGRERKESEGKKNSPNSGNSSSSSSSNSSIKPPPLTAYNGPSTSTPTPNATSTPSAAALPSPAASTCGGLATLDLTQPAPRTKVIPPPRNHILTRHEFKISANDTKDGKPGAVCGFTLTCTQDPALHEPPTQLILIGGASYATYSYCTLSSSMWSLHIPSQKWRKMTGTAQAGGPGAVLHHSAVLIQGKLYVFGGLTYQETFHFATPKAKAITTTTPTPAGKIPTPQVVPLERDAEEEDDAAKRRMVEAKLNGLSVGLPQKKNSNNLMAPDGSALNQTELSPKLEDAAGSPGGGVGHELEDADRSIETVHIPGESDPDSQPKKKKSGGFAWRMASATGKGLWKAAKVTVKTPWKAAKATGKGIAYVGSAVASPWSGSSSSSSTGSHPPSSQTAHVSQPSKSEQYGVQNEAAEIGPVDADSGELANGRVMMPSQMKGEKGSSPSSKAGKISGGAYSTVTPASGAAAYAKPTSRTSGGSSTTTSQRRFDLLSAMTSSSTTANATLEAPSDGLHVFDVQSESWTLELEIRGIAPRARYAHAMAAMTETDPVTNEPVQCFYIFGGCAERNYERSLNDLWKCTISPATSNKQGSCTWSEVKAKGRIPNARHGHTLTNVGHGYLLLFGGASEDTVIDESGFHVTKRMNDIYIYNTKNQTWYPLTTYGTPPSQRAFHTAVLHEDRFLHFFAGEGNTTCMDLSILDLNTLAWSRPLYDSSFQIGMHGMVALDAGKSLVYGGLHNEEGITKECFLLNTLEVIGQCDTYTSLQCKIVICGGKGVGKTSMIRRFVEDRFSYEVKPLGTTHRTVLTLLDGKLCKIHVWDVPTNASLNELQNILKDADAAVLMYDPSQPTSLEELQTWSEQIKQNNLIAASVGGGMTPAAVTPHSKSRRGSDERPEKDENDIDARSPYSSSTSISTPHPLGSPTGTNGPAKFRITVVANKSELSRDLRVIRSNTGRAFAKQLSAHFTAVSCKDSSQVDATFLRLAKKIAKDRTSGGHQSGCTIM